MVSVTQPRQRLNVLGHPITNEKILANNALNKIAIPTIDGLLFFNLNDITYLEAHINYTEIHFTDNHKLTASRTLREFEEMLPSDKFFRPHHSYIINLQYIKRYIRGDGGQIELQNGVVVGVSRRKKDEFLRAIGH
jgi:two-component system LytT family response regulator